MAENLNANKPQPEEPDPREAASEPNLPITAAQSHAAYLKFINYARKAVAIATVACVWIVIFCESRDFCVRSDQYPRWTLARDPGIWHWGAWVFEIGVLACLLATILLIAESLARAAAPRPFTLRSVLVRESLIVVVVVVVAFCLWMALGYGPFQGIGALAGTLSLLAAVKNRRAPRAFFAVVALMILYPTLWSTQTPYQYARRHADEIVAAGCKLMDKLGDSRRKELPVDDPRVPSSLRKLGMYRVCVDGEQVSVYSQGGPEFIIGRNSIGTIGPRFKGNAVYYRITDRLWMIDD